MYLSAPKKKPIMQASPKKKENCRLRQKKLVMRIILIRIGGALPAGGSEVGITLCITFAQPMDEVWITFAQPCA